MKKNKIKKIMERVRRFLDEGYNKKIKDREDLLESLKKMKKREKKLKDKLKEAHDPEMIKKMGQELEIIKKLRNKAKEMLSGENNNK